MDSWSAYVNTFGGFRLVTPPATGHDTKALSYMPFALYTLFQNGGRFAWIVRAVSKDRSHRPERRHPSGDVTNGHPRHGLQLQDRSQQVGQWGNKPAYRWTSTSRRPAPTRSKRSAFFTLRVLQENALGELEVVETFPNLTTTGDVSGTKRVDYAVNDLVLGSRLIRIADIDTTSHAARDDD